MTEAISSQGADLQMKIGGTYTSIAHIVNMDLSSSKDTVDTTHLKSEENWDEHIETIKRAGELNLDLNSLPADATQNESTGLLSALQNSTGKADFKLIFPGSIKTLVFSATVASFQFGIKTGDKMTAKCTLKRSGKPTWS